MCRSTVARVLAIDGGYAVVESDGAERRASTLLVPDLEPGDLVLIGLGTVLGRVTAADAAALRAIEPGPPIQPAPSAPPAAGRAT